MKLVHGEKHTSLGRRIIARRDDGVVLVEGDNGLYAWVALWASICTVHGQAAEQSAIKADLRQLRRAEVCPIKEEN